MTRLIIAALTVAALLAPTNANAHITPKGICTDKSMRITRDMDLATRRHKARRLIVCVFEHIDPSQTQTAVAIATRESGLDPYAYNPSGCAGLFQHMLVYWPSRVKTYLTWREFPNTYPHVHVYLARANAIATARMVSAQGWGAWSTYYG